MSPLQLKPLDQSQSSKKKNKQVILLDNDNDDDAIDHRTASSTPAPLTPPPPAMKKKKPASLETVRRAAMMKKMAVTCTRCNRTFLTALGLLNHHKAHDDHERLLSFKRPREDEKIDGSHDNHHDRYPKEIKSDLHRHRHGHDDQRGTEKTLGVGGAHHGRLVQGYGGQRWPPVIVGPMVFPPPPPHYLAAGEGGFWPPVMAGFYGGVQFPVGQSRVLVNDQTSIVPNPRINLHEEKNSGETSTELDLSLKL